MKKGWHKERVRHSNAKKFGKAGGAYKKKPITVFMHPQRRLRDIGSGAEYSANAGDYWNLKPNDIIPNVELVVDGETVKETVRKKDLIDEIYEAQDSQTDLLNKRKSVGKGKLFYLSTEHGEYVVDDKGRITQDRNWRTKGKKAFSGQWLLEGIADRYGRKIIDWKELLKNPKMLNEIKTRKYQGKLHIIDLDNGTTRLWGETVERIRKKDW